LFFKLRILLRILLRNAWRVQYPDIFAQIAGSFQESKQLEQAHFPKCTRRIILFKGRDRHGEERKETMHELGATESIAAICLRHAQANKAKRVIKVNVKLGELTGIVDHYVAFYWDMVTKDTIAHEAELNFIKVPVVAHCPDCDEDFEVKEYDLTCPKCGRKDTELISGREFMVESIEIE